MTIVFYAFFVIVIILGAFAAMFPARTVEIRRQLKFPDSALSGGWIYATPKRARITGALLVVIGGIAVASGLFPS